MYNVQGVEVFKGPAGFLYGKDPLAGAVNLVRKQPLPEDSFTLGGSYGSFDTVESTVDWNASRSDGKVDFRLNGLWSASDRYRDDMESRTYAVNPSLTWNLDPETKLNFNFEYVDAENSPDNGLPLVNNTIPTVSRRTSYQSAGDFSDQKISRFQVDYETKVSDRLTIRNKTYYRDLDWQTDGTLLRGTFGPEEGAFWLDPGQVQVVRDLAVLDDRQRIFGNQFETILTLDGGRVEHRLLVGLEVVGESDDYTFGLEPLIDVELYAAAPTPWMLIFDQGAPALSSSGDVTNLVVAPYITDQMKLSPKFELLLGARYDFIDSEGDITPLGAGPISFSRDDSELSPMAGLVFAPDPSLSLYANAGRSYAPPSTRLVDEFDPEGREPERGTQVELGVKKRFFGDRLRTTFAIYRMERDNIAIPDENFFTQQSGDQLSRGFEIELAGEPAPRLRTFFSYAYNDSELTHFVPCVPNAQGGCDLTDYSGNTPIMAPEHLVNFWISKSFRNGFGVSGGGRYIDDKYISEDNVFSIDSALVFDAALFFDLEAWRFKLNLKNLTDEDYETRGIAGSTSVIPADPFAVYAGIEFRM